MDAEQMI